MLCDSQNREGLFYLLCLVYFNSFFILFLLFLQVKHAGGQFIQPLSKGQKVRRSGWVMTSFWSVFPQRDTW